MSQKYDFDNWTIVKSENEEFLFIGEIPKFKHDLIDVCRVSELEMAQLSKSELIEQRAFLIESNTLEERCSEATHYTWLDDEFHKTNQDNFNLREEIAQLQKQIDSLLITVETIAELRIQNAELRKLLNDNKMEHEL